MERMKYLEKWERQQGHEADEEEERLERNVRREIDLRCRYEGCGKVCRNKAGFTQHQARMHRLNDERVRFECE